MAEFSPNYDTAVQRAATAWNNRFGAPESATPVNLAAQTAVDHAHAIDSTRWTDPVSFVEAQIRMGVEFPPVTPQTREVAFGTRAHSNGNVPGTLKPQA